MSTVSTDTPGFAWIRFGPNEGWLSLAEAAERLGVSREWAHQLALRGELQYVSLGGRGYRFFHEADVDYLLAKRKAA